MKRPRYAAADFLDRWKLSGKSIRDKYFNLVPIVYLAMLGVTGMELKLSAYEQSIPTMGLNGQANISVQ